MHTDAFVILEGARWVFTANKKEESVGNGRDAFPESAAPGVESGAWRALNSKRFQHFPIHWETNVTVGYVREDLPSKLSRVCT